MLHPPSWQGPWYGGSSRALYDFATPSLGLLAPQDEPAQTPV